jgi:hypothetical protein
MQWSWSDPLWEQIAGDDHAQVVRELRRRCVDLRDELAGGSSLLASRAVMLASVANRLADLISVDTANLFDRR